MERVRTVPVADEGYWTAIWHAPKGKWRLIPEIFLGVRVVAVNKYPRKSSPGAYWGVVLENGLTVTVFWAVDLPVVGQRVNVQTRVEVDPRNHDQVYLVAQFV